MGVLGGEGESGLRVRAAGRGARPGRRRRAGDPREDRAISPAARRGGGALPPGAAACADAFVTIQLAVGFALLGEAALAAELGARALAPNPLGPSWWFYYAVLPHFVLRDYARPSSLDRERQSS